MTFLFLVIFSPILIIFSSDKFDIQIVIYSYNKTNEMQ